MKIIVVRVKTPSRSKKLVPDRYAFSSSLKLKESTSTTRSREPLTVVPVDGGSTACKLVKLSTGKTIFLDLRFSGFSADRLAKNRAS